MYRADGPDWAALSFRSIELFVSSGPKRLQPLPPRGFNKFNRKKGYVLLPLPGA